MYGTWCLETNSGINHTDCLWLGNYLVPVVRLIFPSMQQHVGAGSCLLRFWRQMEKILGWKWEVIADLSCELLISLRHWPKRPCGNNNSVGLRLGKRMSNVLAPSMLESCYWDKPLCFGLGNRCFSVLAVALCGGGEKGGLGWPLRWNLLM